MATETKTSVPKIIRKGPGKIAKCSCPHAGQDSIHGAQNRVFNRCSPKKAGDFFRCTVCKREIG